MKICILVCVIAVLCSYWGKGFLKYGLEWAFGIITVFLSIRYYWGSDYPSYLNMYQGFMNSGISSLDFSGMADLRERGEIGWTLINLLCRPIGFFGMVAILTVFENWVIYSFIKKNVDKKDYWLSIFIYLFCADYFLVGASMMRQWLAMCIFILAIPSISQGKPLRYFLLVLLMASIHLTSLVLLPLYFLHYLQKLKIDSTYFVIGTVFVYLVWFVIGRSAFSETFSLLLAYDEFSEFDVYLSDTNTGISSGLGVLFKSIIAIVLLTKINVLGPNIKTLLLVYVLSIFVLPLTSKVPMIGRIGMYNTVVSIALFPNVFKAFKKDGVCVILTAIWVLWLLYTYFGFWSTPNWMRSFGVYKTIFSVPWM